MSRLETLKSSLEKKEKKLDSKYEDYFEDVKQANGQPLNDKRGGQKILNRWEKKSQSIHNQKIEIEKTKNAIEREKYKIFSKNEVYEIMPYYLKKLIDDGVLKQWSKHPRIMFVNGVEKARIYFDEETKICSHKFVRDIQNQEQYSIFRDVFNNINNLQKGLK
ncbi:hypothetical protein CRU92_10810 [Arcobacter sp. FW59]|uniref:hypothetical protein n=1 Tax=Aliarcobacter lanthieri TaxID=1355374 RepID=UPI000DE8DF06|nr:hypothetical protein [Aliarcobacter lanthieri]MBL3520289.1 hypothetical protein [Aliarcobacter lanthieri]RBQ30656.1 hypothetical protein CRU92_10810 [Arcobacter sp. FW59]